MNPLRVMRRLQWAKTSGEHQSRLELPELLDSIGLKLTEAVYIEPGQRYSTIGQIRLSDWIDKHKNVPTAIMRTKMEFVHRKKGTKSVTKMLRILSN